MFAYLKSYRRAGLIALVLALTLLAGEISSQNGFQVSPVQARPPQSLAGVHHRDLPNERKINIPGLKAILLGAPIDGDRGQWTLSEIENLKKAAAELRRNGVTVYEFYTPSNEWDRIKQVSRGAHFLLYRGHGVYDGSTPPRWVGGFSLKNKFVSSEDIKAELDLAPGAIVMLYGCFTAGNAGFDIGKINQTEADRRVAMYSKPFMDEGYSGYFANWYGDAFQHFIAHLFSGKTLGETYRAYRDFNSSTVKYDRHPDYPQQVMWIDHDDWDSGRAYNYAFVGNPDKTLIDLFGGSNVPDNGNNDVNVSPEVADDLAEEMIRTIYADKADDAIVLLERGANPNFAIKGWTVLSYAVYKNQPTVVAALIARNANVNAVLPDGYTARSLAERLNYTRIVQLLENAGAERRPAHRSMQAPELPGPQ